MYCGVMFHMEGGIVYSMRLKKLYPTGSDFLLGTYGYIRFPISITKLVFFRRFPFVRFREIIVGEQ